MIFFARIHGKGHKFKLLAKKSLFKIKNKSRMTLAAIFHLRSKIRHLFDTTFTNFM